MPDFVMTGYGSLASKGHGQGIFIDLFALLIEIGFSMPHIIRTGYFDYQIKSVSISKLRVHAQPRA